MVMATCLQDCLSTEWDYTNNGYVANKHGTSSTVSNILLAFESELHKMRAKNKISTSTMFGATCTINLPFMVERQMIMCAPNLDEEICSVNLYIVLKKQSTANDEIRTNSMAVRISNGYNRNNAIKKETGNSFIGGGNYSSDSDSTLNEYEAMKLQKKQRKGKSKSD
jgi:hypothetical protein